MAGPSQKERRNNTPHVLLLLFTFKIVLKKSEVKYLNDVMAFTQRGRSHDSDAFIEQ